MFNLTAEQKEQTNKWMMGHGCPVAHEGAIGGKITYSFTPTSLGVVEKVSCSCGVTLNLTEYDEW